MRHSQLAEVRPVGRAELPRDAAVLGDERAAVGQQLVALLVRDLAVAGFLEANGLGATVCASVLSCSNCRAGVRVGAPSERMHAPLRVETAARGARL